MIMGYFYFTILVEEDLGLLCNRDRSYTKLIVNIWSCRLDKILQSRLFEFQNSVSRKSGDGDAMFRIFGFQTINRNFSKLLSKPNNLQDLISIFDTQRQFNPTY